MNANVKPITAIKVGIWTDTALEILKKMYAEGRSARDITSMIPGSTRNAVLGKIHRINGGQSFHKNWTPAQDAVIIRMALSGRTCSDCAKAMRKAKASVLSRAEHLEVKFSARGVSPKTRTERVDSGPIKVTPARQELLDSVAPDSRLLTLDELKRSQCHWPIGDPKEEAFRYCGADKPDGRSFCLHHHAIAYLPASTRKTVKNAQQTAYTAANQRRNAALSSGTSNW